MDSQYIAELVGVGQEIAKADRKQAWVRAPTLVPTPESIAHAIDWEYRGLNDETIKMQFIAFQKQRLYHFLKSLG